MADIKDRGTKRKPCHFQIPFWTKRRSDYAETTMEQASEIWKKFQARRLEKYGKTQVPSLIAADPILGKEKNSASEVTIENSSTLCFILDKGNFEAIVKDHPQLVIGIVQNVSPALLGDYTGTGILVLPTQIHDQSSENPATVQKVYGPSKVLKNEYRALDQKQRAAIDEFRCGLFYPDVAEYDEVNGALLELYGRHKSELICAICPLLEKKNPKMPKKGFHVFKNLSTFRRHHERYHQHQISCMGCGLLFDDKKLLSSHLKSAAVKNDLDHMKG